MSKKPDEYKDAVIMDQGLFQSYIDLRDALPQSRIDAADKKDQYDDFVKHFKGQEDKPDVKDILSTVKEGSVNAQNGLKTQEQDFKDKSQQIKKLIQDANGRPVIYRTLVGGSKAYYTIYTATLKGDGVSIDATQGDAEDDD